MKMKRSPRGTKWKVQHCHVCHEKRWCFFTHGQLPAQGIHVMCKSCYVQYKHDQYELFEWEPGRGILYV